MNITDLVFKLSEEQGVLLSKVIDDVMIVNLNNKNKYYHFPNKNNFYYSSIGQVRDMYKHRDCLQRNYDFLHYLTGAIKLDFVKIKECGGV